MAEVIITINGKPFLGVEKGNERGLLKSAIFVTSQAKRLAPVNKQKGIGGQLKNSIMYKVSGEGRGGFNNRKGDKAVKQLEVRPNENEAYVGSNLDYAIYQEFGTRKMRAQPFLRPAGELLNVDIVVKANREEMKKHLRQGKRVIRFSDVKGSFKNLKS